MKLGQNFIQYKFLLQSYFVRNGNGSGLGWVFLNSNPTRGPATVTQTQPI